MGKLYRYSFLLRKFRQLFPILNNLLKLFMTDGANGHDEMAKWFATVMQYHNLYYPHKEQLELDAVGIVRNMNALDPVCTQRAKLMRKRVLEGSSQKFTKSVSLILNLF